MQGKTGACMCSVSGVWCAEDVVKEECDEDVAPSSSHGIPLLVKEEDKVGVFRQLLAELLTSSADEKQPNGRQHPFGRQHPI